MPDHDRFDRLVSSLFPILLVPYLAATEVVDSTMTTNTSNAKQTHHVAVCPKNFDFSLSFLFTCPSLDGRL